MEIVVGFQGKEHVTAGQVGRILAGMAGDGAYVLDTQNRLAATMVTANQVRIDTGDLVMHGRVATVETPETLTVESGVTGQKRNDLVVARYQKEASTSVESCELVVVKGTAVSYGDPSDPTINDGSILDGDSPVDVPLWRIPIDGLTPGTPVKLFEDTPSISELRDSVSRTGPITVASGQWGKVTAWAFGPVVTVSAQWTSSAQPWQSEAVGTLPDGMRPPAGLFAPFARDNVTQVLGDVCLSIGADGSVAISGRGGAAHQGDVLQATLTYVAA